MGHAKCLEVERARLEKTYFTRFWGAKRLVRPKFVEQALGNGKKLIYLCPANTRPHYYYIRVDSRWQISNWITKGDNIANHLDEILDAIEEEYGPWYEDEREKGMPWPALSADSGCCWGAVDPITLNGIKEKGDA